MKYQFNKTAMQRLKRELGVRVRALPTLKAKETALRMEVQKTAEALHRLETSLTTSLEEKAGFSQLWLEYPAVLSIRDIELKYRNIAGVRIPDLEQVEYVTRDYSLYANRAWVPSGTDMLKEFCRLTIQIELTRTSVHVLNQARKKTTQKVNLYEKVQIPAYQEALRRIKRFLEDEENLSRAAQKIVKERNAVREAS